MIKQIKLNPSELVVDQPLPWSIYDIEGKLLLSVGQIIESKEKLDSLFQHELFRHENAAEVTEVVSPFVQLESIAREVNKAFDELEAANPDAKARLEQAAVRLEVLCDTEADALLGAVHRMHSIHTSIFNPMQCAILADLMTRNKKVSRAERVATIGAGLTCNIGLRGFYDEIEKQDSPISATQRRIIAQHPKKSATMVNAVGIKNANWLKAILQHHELVDGSGYPANLKGDQFTTGAKALAIAERYSMLISNYSKGDPVLISDALKTFFIDEGKKYDSNLCLQFVLALTVFPPGCFVKLANGEIAIVIRRDFSEPMKPRVKSIADENGYQLSEFVERDTAQSEFEIKGMCHYEDCESLDLNKLWDFV